MKDGESWYVLGNAYMFNFFVNMTLITELQNALKAYNQAEINLKKKNPDLHYNRANVQLLINIAMINSNFEDFKLFRRL